MPPPELGSRPQPWFVRRRYGVGYRPLAWQGWAIAGVLVAATVVVLALVHASAARIVIVLALVVVYTAVGWRLSGERPDAGGRGRGGGARGRGARAGGAHARAGGGDRAAAGRGVDAAPPAVRGRGRRDHRRGADQALRRAHRAGRCLVQRRLGRGVRLPRAQRRGQDHDGADARHADRADRGFGRRGRHPAAAPRTPSRSAAASRSCRRLRACTRA